jgi:hypothetical protein
MTNVTDHPREIALAAAQRLRSLISQGKHDIYLQQAMRSAHLVVMQSGILTDEDLLHENRQNGFDCRLTVH